MAERWGSGPDPRSRIFHDAENLEDWELIAVLLGKGSRGLPIEDLSRDILKKSRGLGGLLSSNIPRNFRINGLGKVKVSILLAALELAKRLKYKSIRMAGYNPTTLSSYLQGLFSPLKRECFVLATISPAGDLLRVETVSKGSLEEVGVLPRDLVRIILNDEASQAILAHNHPGMICFPSQEDWEVYTNLKDILSNLDVELLDHWIFGIDGIFSCRQSTRLGEN
ncbi:DNA repair protein [Leptospira selangorensis]|uniref:DNA repair protein n=1 Tax=Leptospira selangorensis TaxID=2484982 RepID=A0A4R9G4X3_9LEPT|nr:JAB domain-containing protein [Leptospira selangorensis]TGK05980.1 DNA repair protein [Leptospira selangorensis]TGM12218.1 DNA repair protein [Leptospira selangorensis]TGM14739.1 DNA repair protein [Leptospira selangorensis]